MKTSQEIEGSLIQRLERIWMASLVGCAMVYMGCMMIEMGPRSAFASIAKPIEVTGLVAGMALFVIGIFGALVFARSD